jgi:hypothetical protein
LLWLAEVVVVTQRLVAVVQEVFYLLQDMR